MQKELLYSDSIYLGGRVIPVCKFKSEFPEWYEIWKESRVGEIAKDYCLIPDYSYGVSATLNAIYSVNLEKATAEYLCSFENNDNKGEIYHPPIRMGNVLLFMPCKADKWAYYNLDTCMWSYEEIPADFIKEGMFVKGWLQIGNQVVYMPGSANVLVTTDLKNGNVSYHNCLDEIRKKSGKLLEFTSIVAYEDSVLLFTNIENNVYEIDTKTMQLTKIHKISLECEGIQAAISVPGVDWIFILEHSRATRIIKWDIKNGSTEVISELPIHPDKNSISGLILGFCYDCSGLYIIPQQDNCIIKIDYNKNEAIRIELNTGINLLERRDEFYHRWGYGLSYTPLVYNGYENTTTVFLPYDFSIAEIDFQKGTFYNKRKWRVNGIENLVRDSMKSQIDGIYMENNYFTVKEFIKEIGK